MAQPVLTQKKQQTTNQPASGINRDMMGFRGIWAEMAARKLNDNR
jgi:hypothetical protein